MFTCLGCRDLRAQEIAIDATGTKGVAWFCVQHNRRVGEDTQFSFSKPVPVSSECWIWELADELR